MLVLSRKPGESIHIGDDVTVTVLKTSGGTVRLGFEAPDDVRILRSELNECPAVPFKKAPPATSDNRASSA